jgi:hypothetical protein
VIARLLISVDPREDMGEESYFSLRESEIAGCPQAFRGLPR